MTRRHAKNALGSALANSQRVYAQQMLGHALAQVQDMQLQDTLLLLMQLLQLVRPGRAAGSTGGCTRSSSSTSRP